MSVYSHTLSCGESLELHIRRHARTIKITMRVYDKVIRLTVPKSLPNSKVHDFLKDNDEWIETQLHKQNEQLSTAGLQLPNDLMAADSFPYLGEMVPFSIKASTHTKLDYSDGALTYTALPSDLTDSWNLGTELTQLLQFNLIDILDPLVDQWTKALGVQHTGVKFSGAKKRWGSCTSAGKLRFNWRLIFTPKFVIEAIVIHEVCHLVELNHGQDFKALEKKCNPRVAESDRWLKEQGWAVLTFDL